MFQKLCSVFHTASSDSAGCIIPRSQSPRCASHHGVKNTQNPKRFWGIESISAMCITFANQSSRCASQLRGKASKFLKNSAVCVPPLSQSPWCTVHQSADKISTLCITPQSQAPQCASHRRVKLRSVHHTAESNYTRQCQNFRAL